MFTSLEPAEASEHSDKMTKVTSQESTSTLSWLRQRKIQGIQRCPKYSPSFDLLSRLKLEATLDGHLACVNCLEWNQSGSLLASGSDDRKVIIWDPFKRLKKSVVDTSHEGNIFSVKFIPNSSDLLVASSASDSSVKLTSTLSSRNLLDCRGCHSDRVKRLAVHSDEPNIIWSSGEDGLILQYDTRESHVCRQSKSRNLLIDLKSIHPRLKAKCLAVNPMKSEMLAVGATDIFNRIYDRRFLKIANSELSSTVYFAPGHLFRSNNRSNHLQSYGTSYLSFSPDGTELLASVHAEQVYLFDLVKPWERYKTFELSLSPILFSKSNSFSYEMLNCSDLKTKSPTRRTSRRGMSNSSIPIHWSELMAKGEDRCCKLSQDAKATLQSVFNEKPMDTKQSRILLDYVNKSMEKTKFCPELYLARAKLLSSRGWRGDYYEAIRDCCCALALEPLNPIAIYYLAETFTKLGHAYPVGGLLDFIELMLKNDHQSSCDQRLQKAYSCLKNMKNSSSRNGNYCVCDNNNDLEEPAFMVSLLSDHDKSSSMDIQELLFTSLSKYKTRNELQLSQRAYDYTRRFCGHCNMNTDIKEANFFGSRGDFIVGGSDDGAFYIWEKKTGNIVKAVDADYQILNCLQPHPNICMLATSGIESSVKLWSANGTVNRDVGELETRCMQNQEYISADPLETMILMLYPGLS